MRYLLFFFFLFLHSHFVFSQAPQPVCTGATSNSFCSDESPPASCSGGYIRSILPQACLRNGTPIGAKNCQASCTCPPPYIFKGYGGAASPDSGCSPPACPAGSTWSFQSHSCVSDQPSEPPPDSCSEAEKVYDPVSGLLVCPGSGDGNSSAAASSNSCVVPGDFNGDCVPDDEQASSANNSTPTSSPDSGSAASAGGDDGGDNGGGGGDDGGNNNSGGGSASSASSSPSGVNNSTGSGSSSGAVSSSAGQCDPTAKNYLSCISSQKITAEEGDIPWVPNSGYGNWIPVSEDSPCPNKYRDASGEWWCSGGGTGGANGSATSGGASGSARSAAGKCDSTSEDYLRCISGQLSSSGSQTSASSANSSAARSSSKSGAFSSLGEKGEFDGEASEKKMDELKEELDQKIADIKADIQGEFGGTISGTGTIQDFCKSNIHRAEVCFGLKKWEPFLDPISAAIFLVACVMAFSIVLRG